MSHATWTKIVSILAVCTPLSCGYKNFFANSGETSRRSKSGEAQSSGPSASKASGTSNSPGVSPATPPANPNATLAPVSQLEEWCSKASQTKAVQDKLGPTFKHLCDGGKPSDLLKETLVKRAYSGGDNLQIVDIEPLQSDRATKTTFHTFAVGIKIPIPIKTHFEKVAPKSSDPAEMKALAEMDGATASITIEKEHKQDGPFHVSGKSVLTKLTQDLVLAVIEMQSLDRIDQHAIKDGESYLYTRYIEQVMKGVLRFDMVTAGLKIGTDSYLLSAVSFKIENMGFASIAEERLKDLAKNTIKRMHALAEDAGGTP